MPEVEQHIEQIRIVDNSIAVHIGGVCARCPEVEQHQQQVGVVDAPVAVRVAVADEFDDLRLQEAIQRARVGAFSKQNAYSSALIQLPASPPTGVRRRL